MYCKDVFDHAALNKGWVLHDVREAAADLV